MYVVVNGLGDLAKTAQGISSQLQQVAIETARQQRLATEAAIRGPSRGGFVPAPSAPVEAASSKASYLVWGLGVTAIVGGWLFYKSRGKK